MSAPRSREPVDALIGEKGSFAKTISESDVYLFAGITGDLAAYHVNEQFMAASPFGRRIAHGVLVLGLASTVSTVVLSRCAEPNRTISLGYDRVRFIHPVFIGDTLTATYEVQGFEWDAMRGHSSVQVVNQSGDVCLSAVHVLKILS